jgi:hypothetical protein
MKTEHQLSDDILKVTSVIRDEYPELLKYLNEMPVTIPDVNKPAINIKALQDYYDSLLDLLRKYAPNHGIFNSNF